MTFKRTLGILIIVVLSSAIFFTACKKEDLPNPDGGTLSFSTDTVQFDTIFTTIGSTTKAFKVYNPTSQKVNIDEIRLAGGQGSQFRINIDGTPTPLATDIELLAGDSMWVFVEVTIDPQNQNTPFIVADSVMFTTNGETQSVLLVASGQDAHYYYPTQFSDEGLPAVSVLDCNDNFWTSDKPHVIFGTLVVNTGCTLTIDAGAKVYFYKNSSIVINEGATLIVNGTADNKVTFLGTRLEQYLENVAGQWGTYYQIIENGQVFRIPIGGIWFVQGSQNNKINHAVIKNAQIGLQADPGVTLELTNTEVYNHTGYGLLSQGATISGYNNVVSNCGVNSVALTFGGNYDFRHCTFVNYWSGNVRQTPALLISNNRDSAGINVTYPLSAYFGNSVICGNVDNETGISIAPGAPASLKFEKCLIKIDPEFDTSNPNIFSGIIKNPLPELKFKDTFNNDYRLDTLTVAQDAGLPSITNTTPQILKDIINTDRIILNGPDLGAYEKPW